jgi:hypothetical protein
VDVLPTLGARSRPVGGADSRVGSDAGSLAVAARSAAVVRTAPGDDSRVAGEVGRLLPRFRSVLRRFVVLGVTSRGVLLTVLPAAEAGVADSRMTGGFAVFSAVLGVTSRGVLLTAVRSTPGDAPRVASPVVVVSDAIADGLVTTPPWSATDVVVPSTVGCVAVPEDGGAVTSRGAPPPSPGKPPAKAGVLPPMSE